MRISNWAVYGLHESLIASGYPMKAELPRARQTLESGDIRGRGRTLASTPIGSGHDNFLNGIIVQFDIDWPIKLWTEAQRYHFLDFVSSMSTMHRLAKMNLKEAFDNNVDPIIIARMDELQNEYNNIPDDSEGKQQAFLKMAFSCPVGLNLGARMTTNYRQLKTIYAQRKNHRLPQWREFCKWVEELPLMKELGII